MSNIGNITRFCFDLNTSDIVLLNAGIQVKTDHSFGPYTNAYHVLHYITAGKGSLTINGRTFALEKGDLFFLPMGVACSYEADKNDPYQYYWLAFKGNYANELLHYCHLSAETPLAHYDSKTMKQAFSECFQLLKEPVLHKALKVLSNFYLIFSLLLQQQSETQSEDIDFIIQRCIAYMAENYQQPLTITNICKQLHVNRTVFSEQFKKSLKISPKDYLLNLKLTKATALLKDKRYSIEMVASLVGMSHVAFCKIFKKRMDCTPMEYRKTQLLKKTEKNNM